MRKRKQMKTVLSILMMIILLIGMIPDVAFAAIVDDTQYLEGFYFMSSADSTIITGETTNINIKLFQDMGSYENPFTGSVTAIISDSNGNQTIYPVSGNYTISNVTIDIPGDYSLNIVASYPNYGSAVGTLNVVNAVANVSGSLVINSKNTLSIKVTDSDGSPLARKSITVDGSTIGATMQSLTTLNDGTISFQMTPSSYGTVNIIHAGLVIGTIPVVPAYTQNARIGGTTEDNVSLSVEISKSGWTEGTANVILLRDDQFSDALAAVPLSKKLNAPILMTDSSALDEQVLAGLRELSAKNVYIIGGTVAISQSIQDSLSSMGFNVTRIAGAQGYDTAAEVSSFVGVDNTHTVYLANGHGIPDAIAVSAFAAVQGSPILLTERAQLPASTIQALTDLGAYNIVLLGGEAVISSEVENELGVKYSVKRWGGYDRYDTQSIIFQNLLNTENPQSPLYFTSGLVRQDDVSSGKPYADALLTAALAAKTGGYVAMLPRNNIPSSLNYFLLFNKGYITKTTVVGNNSGVSLDIELQLQQMLYH